MARQDFARGMHRHVALSRGHFYRVQSQGTATGHPSQGIDTGYCHRVLCHRIPSQGIDTGYCHRVPSRDKCYESLPRINAAAQHHSGI